MCNRSRSADRGQGSLVAVSKRNRSLAPNLASDVVGGVNSLLNCRGGDTGDVSAIRSDSGQVADHIDILKAGHPTVRIDQDPACPVERNVQRVGQLRGLNSRI